MKHGMMTVRPLGKSVNGGARNTMRDDHSPSEHNGGAQPTSKPPMDDDAKSLTNAQESRWNWLRKTQRTIARSGRSWDQGKNEKDPASKRAQAAPSDMPLATSLG